MSVHVGQPYQPIQSPGQAYYQRRLMEAQRESMSRKWAEAQQRRPGASPYAGLLNMGGGGAGLFSMGGGGDGLSGIAGDDAQPYIQALMTAAQLYMMSGCWVAREIYGAANPKWLRALKRPPTSDGAWRTTRKARSSANSASGLPPSVIATKRPPGSGRSSAAHCQK